MTSSLDVTENLASESATSSNRVSLQSIKDNIDEIEYVNSVVCPHMTIALVKMLNGFVVVGKSAPADPANFNPELGKKFAYEDCIRQLWQLEGYALCSYLHDVRAEPRS